MRRYWVIDGRCPDCHEPLYFDTEAGEPVPHRCQEETEEEKCLGMQSSLGW